MIEKPELELEQESNAYTLFFSVDKKIGIKACGEIIQLLKVMVAISETIPPDQFCKLLPIVVDNMVSLFNITQKETYTKEELLGMMDVQGNA